MILIATNQQSIKQLRTFQLQSTRDIDKLQLFSQTKAWAQKNNYINIKQAAKLDVDVKKIKLSFQKGT